MYVMRVKNHTHVCTFKPPPLHPYKRNNMVIRDRVLIQIPSVYRAYYTYTFSYSPRWWWRWIDREHDNDVWFHTYILHIHPSLCVALRSGLYIAVTDGPLYFRSSNLISHLLTRFFVGRQPSAFARTFAPGTDTYNTIISVFMELQRPKDQKIGRTGTGVPKISSF